MCVASFFKCLSISWEPFSCFTLFFNKCSWYYLGDYLTKETFFPASLPVLGAILRYFGAYFGLCSSSFESCFSSYLMKFNTDVFCITVIVSVLRKISQHLSLCWWTLCNILGPILGILLDVLRNVKYSLEILHECLDITVVVTRLRN